MIYTPQNKPRNALIMIITIVVFGILGGYFFHKSLMLFALFFWMQYTFVLSFLQFKNKSKHKKKKIIDFLLNPTIRFGIFEFLAFVGFFSVLYFNTLIIGAIALGTWMGFSINFYIYYNQFKKYE